MPIITYEDEKLLGRLDIEVARQYNTIASRIKQITKQEVKLGDSYQKYTKDLQDLTRKMRDKSKQMEILAREDRSGVSDTEVKAFKSQVASVDDRIKAIEIYSDRIKDLALQKQGIIDRLQEYTSMVVPFARLRQEIVDISLRIEKEKNKMVAADTLSKLEDKMKDKQREFDRSKNELQKKWSQVDDERAEVNKMWHALKDCVDDFE